MVNESSLLRAVPGVIGVAAGFALLMAAHNLDAKKPMDWL